MRANPSANHHHHDRQGVASDLGRVDDDTLLRRARAGEPDAFGELYARHRRAALRYAGGLTHRYLDPGGAEDVLAEAIRKMLTAIAAGAGPVTNFRRYLFTSIRSAAVGRARDRRRAATPEASIGVGDRTQDVVDMVVARETFHALPQRWQDILWATSVDQLTPAELAPTLGMRPNSVAVLAHRARAAFRNGFLDSK